MNGFNEAAALRLERMANMNEIELKPQDVAPIKGTKLVAFQNGSYAHIQKLEWARSPRANYIQFTSLAVWSPNHVNVYEDAIPASPHEWAEHYWEDAPDILNERTVTVGDLKAKAEQAGDLIMPLTIYTTRDSQSRYEPATDDADIENIDGILHTSAETIRKYEQDGYSPAEARAEFADMMEEERAEYEGWANNETYQVIEHAAKDTPGNDRDGLENPDDLLAATLCLLADRTGQPHQLPLF